jgi:hypothetical protein
MDVWQFQDMWTTNKDDYVLVKSTQNGYGIIDIKTKSVVIIEDDGVYEQVIEMMLKNNKILEKF